MNRNKTNDTLSKNHNLELSTGTTGLQPVDGAELAGISGGVGPVFDTSKVEGFQLPSWYLPKPQLPGTYIR